jgi:hypothetical protein
MYGKEIQYENLVSENTYAIVYKPYEIAYKTGIIERISGNGEEGYTEDYTDGYDGVFYGNFVTNSVCNTVMDLYDIIEPTKKEFFMCYERSQQAQYIIDEWLYKFNNNICYKFNNINFANSGVTPQMLYNLYLEGFWVNNDDYKIYELMPMFKNAAAADDDTDEDTM